MRRLLAATVTPLFASLVALALVPGSDDDVVRRNHVRFSTEKLAVPSCRDVAGAGPELGLANIRFRYEVVDGHRLPDGRYAGRVAFTLSEVVIRMPKAIVWPLMTQSDRSNADELRRAIYHHEIGHVRIAEDVRDALNAHETLFAPDAFAFGSAADAVGRAGFARFKQEERDYDDLTDHGRRQHAAPGELAGSDTVLPCRGPDAS